MIDNVFEPKYQNRFVLNIPAIPLLNDDNATITEGGGPILSSLMIGLEKASRPEYTVGIKDITRFNEKTFFAGKPAHSNAMECDFWDYINNQSNTTTANLGSSSEILYKWFNTVYNLEQGSQGFKEDYSTSAHLFLLDPHGNEIEHWVYDNLWPVSVKYGDVSYSADELCKVSCTYQYDKVKLVGNADTTKGFTSGY